MLLVVDIGNTNIVMALNDGKEWVANWRIYSDQKKTSDEYLVIVERMLKYKGFRPSNVKKAVISSVVPNLTRSIQKVVKEFGKIDIHMVKHTSAVGLNIESIPSELGYDLLANAVAARHKWPNDNCLILDFGTALTLTTVAKNGDLMGVSIAPGLVTAVNSLFHNTAQIPQVQLRVPEKAIGRNTEESIRSGIMYGYTGLVKELIRMSKEELKDEAKVIATGGLSRTMAPLIGEIDSIEPLHTLEGLKIIAEKFL
jgi:type III pantothenate kinase